MLRTTSGHFLAKEVSYREALSRLFQARDELLETMRSHPHLIEAALHFFSVCRHVERIGDCATNIAEDVIYLVEGEIARHHMDNLDPARHLPG